MKSEQLASAIAQEFYPYLEIGACLIHQDYKHYYTPWIHVLQYRLRDSFESFYNVKCGATFSFKVVSKMSPAIIRCATDFSEITDQEIAEAIAYSIDLVDSLGKSNIAASHVMHFLNAERFEEAGYLFQHYTDEYGLTGELTSVEKILKAHTQERVLDD